MTLNMDIKFADMWRMQDDDKSDGPDGTIDVVSSAESDEAQAGSRGQADRRSWVGIHFECCGAYTRIYRRPDARVYQGYCPRCGRRVTLRVGPDGVNARIFRAMPA